MRRLLFGLLAPALAASAIAVPALAKSDNGAGGVTGPAIYVDGVAYRTVGTPTDFTNTGAPDHSYDTIYSFPDPEDSSASLQMSVATAGPGDPGFNGGRWHVVVVPFTQTEYQAALAMYDTDMSGDLNSAAEVQAAIDGLMIETGDGPSFECPVIPLPGNGHS